MRKLNFWMKNFIMNCSIVIILLLNCILTEETKIFHQNIILFAKQLDLTCTNLKGCIDF